MTTRTIKCPLECPHSAWAAVSSTEDYRLRVRFVHCDSGERRREDVRTIDLSRLDVRGPTQADFDGWLLGVCPHYAKAMAKKAVAEAPKGFIF